MLSVIESRAFRMALIPERNTLIMVTIRLSRGGSKRRPFYSILVADQRRSARGKFIERIGFIIPWQLEKKRSCELKQIGLITGWGRVLNQVTQLTLSAKAKAQSVTEAA